MSEELTTLPIQDAVSNGDQEKERKESQIVVGNVPYFAIKLRMDQINESNMSELIAFARELKDMDSCIFDVAQEGNEFIIGGLTLKSNSIDQLEDIIQNKDWDSGGLSYLGRVYAKAPESDQARVIKTKDGRVSFGGLGMAALYRAEDGWSKNGEIKVYEISRDGEGVAVGKKGTALRTHELVEVEWSYPNKGVAEELLVTFSKEFQGELKSLEVRKGRITIIDVNHYTSQLLEMDPDDRARAEYNIQSTLSAIYNFANLAVDCVYHLTDKGDSVAIVELANDGIYDDFSGGKSVAEVAVGYQLEKPQKIELAGPEYAVTNVRVEVHKDSTLYVIGDLVIAADPPLNQELISRLEKEHKERGLHPHESVIEVV